MAQLAGLAELPLTFGYGYLGWKGYEGALTIDGGPSLPWALVAILAASASLSSLFGQSHMTRKLNVAVDDEDGYDGEPSDIDRIGTLLWQFPDSARIVPVVFMSLILTVLGLGVTSSPFLRPAVFAICAAMGICHALRAFRVFLPSETAMKLDAFNEICQSAMMVICLLPMTVAATTGNGMVATNWHGQEVPFFGSFSFPVWFAAAVFQFSLLVFIWLSAVNLAKGIERLSGWLRPYNVVFFTSFHIFALAGLWRLCNHTPASASIPSRQRLLGDGLILYLVGGLGVTGGVHRLWSHRSYKANLPYRIIMLMFQAVTAQGTIYDWSRDHRAHHLHSEKEADPHNAMKGFFYSHMGWLLTKRPRAVVAGRRKVDVSDLLKDPCVRIQLWLDPYFNLVVCFLLPSIYGSYRYGDFWLGFFTLGCLRWIWTLHCTWCVNSVAHLWGPRPYNENSGARESFVTSLLACGEGWHSWHHQYSFDYAASELGALRQYNPTKMWIDFFARIGWVWDRKRATTLWEQTLLKRRQIQYQTLRAIHASASRAGSENTADANGELTPTSGPIVRFPTVSIQSLINLIPVNCHRISVCRAVSYLLRDILAVTCVAVSCAFLWIWFGNLRAGYQLQSSFGTFAFNAIEVGFFVVYSLAQGTVMVALWVAAYECAGGRFSRWKSLNTVVGAVLSTILMVPYHHRRAYDSARKRKLAAHLSRSLYEDVFSIFDISRWTIVSDASGVPGGIITGTASVSSFAVAVYFAGWRGVASWYFGAWIVMNLWLLLYHHLLLNKVHRTFSSVHPRASCVELPKDFWDTAAMGEMAKEVNELSKSGAGDSSLYYIPEVSSAGVEVDPHSIAMLQSDSATPLAPQAVDFFTREWLLSAMEVFDRTYLTKRFKDRPAFKVVGSGDRFAGAVTVKFVVRLLVFFFGSLHHHLSHLNVLQSIDVSVPHYHARHAMEEIVNYLDTIAGSRNPSTCQ